MTMPDRVVASTKRVICATKCSDWTKRSESYARIVNEEEVAHIVAERRLIYSLAEIDTRKIDQCMYHLLS